jgi:post-segregation antitoxin (ccd killing protein)
VPPAVLDDPVSPAHARLGSEGLARLRARYADVSATISRRIADEQRREQLQELAERLNPDSWVTHDEVQRGLDAYESVLASLREVVGRRRRRKRSRSAAAPGKPADEAVSSDGESGPDDGDSDDSEPV